LQHPVRLSWPESDACYISLLRSTGRFYLAKHVRFHPHTFPCASPPATPPPLSSILPWMIVTWTSPSMDRAAQSSNTSASLHPTSPSTIPPYPTASLSPASISSSSSLSNPSLVVDLSSYFPTSHSPHHMPSLSASDSAPVSDTRIHHMVLRLTILPRRQANTATSVVKQPLSEPTLFKQANNHKEWQ
jgi:hypothetical protein